MPPKLSRQNSAAAMARKGAAAAAAAPAASANGYKLPDPIPAGEILRSSNDSQRWKLGKSIGVGGFGEIYLCTETTAGNSNCRAASASFEDSAPLAVKIEPGSVCSSVHSLKNINAGCPICSWDGLGLRT